jgi:Xaa-Pro aminopeptidase
LEADKVARDIIDRAGYGDRFVHSLGHGVGLEVHEQPYLSKRSKSILRENEVVTIEPGIYIPGWSGVRIEDMIVVESDGVRNLTNFDDELIEL